MVYHSIIYSILTGIGGLSSPGGLVGPGITPFQFVVAPIFGTLSFLTKPIWGKYYDSDGKRHPSGKECYKKKLKGHIVCVTENNKTYCLHCKEHCIKEDTVDELWERDGFVECDCLDCNFEW